MPMDADTDAKRRKRGEGFESKEKKRKAKKGRVFVCERVDKLSFIYFLHFQFYLVLNATFLSFFP